MLTTTQLAGFGANGSPFLLDIIAELGLNTNLNLVLDAADLRSYDGSSQTWTDATGQGNNFFRGTTSGAEATDPTFVGTAGGPTEGTYFSFDGGDGFQQSAAHTFPANWHKDNGAFTMLAVFFPIGSAVTQAIFSNSPADGIIWYIDASEVLSCEHAITNVATQVLAGTAVTTSAWNFVSINFNEAGPSCSLRTQTTVTSPATTASTCTDASTTISVCPSIIPLVNTSRLACFAAWSTDIGATSLTGIYTALKARRFTSLP
jgi:hypothetical protein